MMAIGRDLVYAIRLWRRRPVAAATGLLALTLGIGLSASVLTVAHAVLWRSLAIPESERLIWVSEVGPPPLLDRTRVSQANAIDWGRSARTLDGLATFSIVRAPVLDGGPAEEIECAAVSPPFFRIIPARVVTGRTLNADDYRGDLGPSEASVTRLQPGAVVISSALWKRRFGARPDLIGSTVRFRTYGAVEVVGVLDEAFAFPMFGGLDCWFPDTRNIEQRSARFLMAIGRLAPGATLAAAQAEVDVIAARLARAHPESNAGRGVAVTPLQEHISEPIRTQVWFLLAAAVCVLATVCANVSSLVIAGAASRRCEFATRGALGATRWRLSRQILVESLALALTGGAAGFLLTWSVVPWLVAQAPPGLPRLDEVHVDAATFWFSFAIALVVGLLSGAAAMGGGITGRPTRVHYNYRWLLVTGEIAIALILAVTANLLGQSMKAISSLPLGFEPSRALSVAFSPDVLKVNRQGGKHRFETELVTAIRTVPGVVSAGIGPPPLGSGLSETTFAPSPDSSEAVPIEVAIVSPGYFDALGTRLVSGRLLDGRDDRHHPLVVVVNQRARQSLLSESAEGKRVLVGGRPAEIVGVVEDVHLGALERDPKPILFMSSAQMSTAWTNNIIVRTAGEPTDTIAAIRNVVQRFDPEMPLRRTETLEEIVRGATRTRRFTLTLLLLFSFTASTLAIVGVYGIVADWISQRVPEIGVRMALGASRGSVVRLVVAQGAVMVGVGLMAGTIVSLTLRQFMTAFVFGVPATDPLSYGLALLAVSSAGLVACLLPAQRAARVDPAAVLRHE